MQIPFTTLKNRSFLVSLLTYFFRVLSTTLLVYVLAVLMLANHWDYFFITLTSGLLLIVYLVSSLFAHQFIDKYPARKLFFLVKICEFIIIVAATCFIYFHNLSLLILAELLLMPIISFSSIAEQTFLPTFLDRNQLIDANLIRQLTLLTGIFLGALLGSAVIYMEKHGISLILLSLVLSSAISLSVSFLIPLQQTSVLPDRKLTFSIIQIWKEFNQDVRQEPSILFGVLGITWYWLLTALSVGLIYSLFNLWAERRLAIMLTFLCAVMLGIIAGGFVLTRALKKEISTRFVPLGVLALSIFLLDLMFASDRALQAHLQANISFFSSFAGWRLIIDIFLVALFGLFFCIPLYAYLQADTEVNIKSRIIAFNIMANTFFIGIALLLAWIFYHIHSHIPGVFLALAIFNAIIAVYICRVLPHAVIQSFVKWLLALFYQVKVVGIENYHKAGKRAIIIANHTSFLDVPILAAFLPDKFVFAVDTLIAGRWWMRPLLRLVDAFKIDPTKPMALKPLIKAIRKNRKCIIFPEGRITVTGALMKVYEGPGMIADKTKSLLLPIRIEGAQYSLLSRLHGKVRIRWFPKITITILPPKKFDIGPEIKGRRRRELISLKLYDLMSDMIFKSSQYSITLFQALIDARKLQGSKQFVVEDINRNPMNLGQLVLRSLILGRKIKPLTQSGEAIGILLPNTMACVLVFFAAQAHSRVAAMLNYTSGANNVLLACKMAQIKHVFTSQAFVNAAQLQPIIDKLNENNVHIHYLENIRQSVNFIDKFTSLCAARFINFYYSKLKPALPTAPAVILFTSGSEGTPKGVVLSHENIQANRQQISASVPFTLQDSVFNALPMFHAFGLTAGTLLPIFSGIKVFLYPSPLHYRIVPELIYEMDASIMFGTDTFLAGYAKYAHPYDFYNMRYIFAGAEKVKDKTHALWSERFGLRILEGYGTTETAPVIATNTPMHSKRGTVGRLLPGMEAKLEPSEGISVGGRLWVKGPNVMLGYLTIQNPGELQPTPEGWHDTGDIVNIDTQGFITILDRAKRFAKIAGEMISLTAIENYLGDLWPAYQHAAINVEDSRKGEKIILVTTNKSAVREDIVKFARARGINELSIPNRILFIDEMPVLGSGKVNYVAVREWLMKQLAN